MRYVRICLAALLLLGVFAISDIASAANWYYVGRNTGLDTYFIDNDSVKKNNREATMWVRVMDTDGTSALYLLHIDRPSRKMRYLSSVKYNAAGEVVASSHTATEWKAIVPDSMMDVIFDLVW